MVGKTCGFIRDRRCSRKKMDDEQNGRWSLKINDAKEKVDIKQKLWGHSLWTMLKESLTVSEICLDTRNGRCQGQLDGYRYKLENEKEMWGHS